MLEFTEWAVDILTRSDTAARRFNPDARVRLVRDLSDGVRFELTDEPAPTDEVVDDLGFTLLVEEGLEGTVDVVEPHDRLILRPPGDTDRSVRDDAG
jgi:plasmid stabilization system protein ParE